MKKINWKLIEEASENGIESMSEQDVQTIWRFIISFDDTDSANVLNQVVNEGVEKLSPQASRLFNMIKDQHGIIEEKKPEPAKRDSVIDEDGNVLYDNSRDNEMKLSEMYGDEDKSEEAPRDSSFMEKGMNRIKDFLK